MSILSSNNNNNNSESVKVTVRCRPPNKNEHNNCWNLWEKNKILSNDPRLKKQHAYSFDNVLYGSDNHALYSSGVESLISQAMEGYNATVFAYGQTASGKTFTMTGTNTEPGVIPRSVDDVFQFIKKATTREFLLRVSYLEIYNEAIKDLLNPSNDSNLKIATDKMRGVCVSGLTEEVVTCKDDVMSIIERGEANRHISSTDYNLHSSRSHTLFQMIIESRERSANSNNPSTTLLHRRTLTSNGYQNHNKPTMEAVRISQLNLIDLAGSEKAASNEERRKEGSYINKSLLTLGTVISKLTEARSPNSTSHIPFRDSKLTRILQTALTGMAKVAVICTISPSIQSMEESVNTLKFASRVKKITIHAKNDEVMDDKALIQKYRGEIQELKSKLKQQEEKDSANLAERRDHAEQIRQMRSVKSAMKERIDHLTKLILNSSSVAIPNDDELHMHPALDADAADKIDSALLIQQLQQQVKKLTLENEQKDSKINYLEHQLRVQTAISSQLQAALSITRAEVEVNQRKTPVEEKPHHFIASPPHEDLSTIDEDYFRSTF